MAPSTRIRTKKYAVSKMSGFVWTWPKKEEVHMMYYRPFDRSMGF